MNDYAPTKKNNTTMIVVIILVAGCALCIPIFAAILFPVFAQAKEAAKRTASMSNIKQLGVGMLMYAGDNDATYCPKEKWCDSIASYVKNTEVWKSPKGDEKDPNRVDYAMIAARGGQKLPPVLEAPKTPLLFESGSGDKNQYGHFEMLPKPPRYNKNGQSQALVCNADGSAGFVTYKSLGLEP